MADSVRFEGWKKEADRHTISRTGGGLRKLGPNLLRKLAKALGGKFAARRKR